MSERFCIRPKQVVDRHLRAVYATWWEPSCKMEDIQYSLLCSGPPAPSPKSFLMVNVIYASVVNGDGDFRTTPEAGEFLLDFEVDPRLAFLETVSF